MRQIFLTVTLVFFPIASLATDALQSEPECTDDRSASAAEFISPQAAHTRYEAPITPVIKYPVTSGNFISAEPPRLSERAKRDLISRTIRAHRHEMLECYSSARTQNPELEGTVHVHTVILSSGRVSVVESLGGIDDPALVRCTLSIFRGMKFPQLDRDTSVMYPVSYTAQ